MRSRSVVLVLGLVWLASLLAATLLTPPGAMQGPKRPDSFSHKDHVPSAWSRQAPRNGKPGVPETFRDCRGCHAFGPDQPVSSPQEHCEKCHDDKLRIAFEGGADKDLTPFASRTRQAFRHHTHGMLECRQCHLPDTKIRMNSLPIETGPGQCAQCHEKTQAKAAIASFRWFEGALQSDELARAIGLPGKFEVPTDVDAYADKLDRAFASPGEGINALLQAGGNFTHGDHLALDCRSCHEGIDEAGLAGTGTGAIEASGCGECHIRADGEAASVAAPTRMFRESWSLGAFAHSDHFGSERKGDICTAQAYADYKTEGSESCAQCHVYAPERLGFDGRDFPFDGESSNHRYQDCQQCHAVDGWRTGEANKPVPLHGSGIAGDRSAAAGAASGWSSEEAQCTSCHVFGEPDMAATRPQASVQRLAGTTFVFAGQTHPYITTDGGGAEDVQKTCTECHRAVVPSLPSRLIEKRFRHATHLPGGDAQLASKDCTQCHPGSAQAGSSETLAIDYRTYDMKVCSECHLGDPVRESLAADFVPKRADVVSFPHEPHALAELSCTECHVLGADGEDIQTKPESLSCSQCHDHILQEDGPRTEYVFGDEVKSCANCHDAAEDGTVAVPAIRGTEAAASDPHYGAMQGMFAGFADAQFHPSSSECATCHRANIDEGAGRLRAIRLAEQDFVLADRDGQFHSGTNGKDQIRQRFNNKPAGCISCHWVKFNAVDKYKEARPETPESRSKFGNQFEGWPGLKSDG
ncbi:MAG: cytochrome c3 family protein [Planctomycetota bacterium]